MGQTPEQGVVVDADDRPLTAAEKQRLAEGKELVGGNGSWPSFKDVPPETMAQYRQKAIETKRLNKEARKLADRLAYLEAHKQHAATILGGRVALVEGLLTELVNPKTGKPDTTRMSEKRLQVLQTMLNDFDKGMGMQPQAKSETQNVNVNVTHTVSKILDRLGEG